MDAADANGATPIHYAVQHTSEPTEDEQGLLSATVSLDQRQTLAPVFSLPFLPPFIHVCID